MDKDSSEEFDVDDELITVFKDPKVSNYRKSIARTADAGSASKRKLNINNEDFRENDIDENNDDYYNFEADAKKIEDDVDDYSDREMELEYDEDLESEEEEEDETEEANLEAGFDGEGQYDFNDNDNDNAVADDDDDDLYYGAANAFNEINVNCGDNSSSTTTHILFPEADPSNTTEEFAEDMILWKSLHNVSNAGALSLLKMLQKHFPQARLPLKESKNGVLSLDLDSFTSKNPRNFEMHVCRAGCSSFINETEKDMVCTVCKKERLRPCKQHGCENPLCDPFSGEFGNHSLGGRRSFRSIHYCPVIPLFKELAQKSIEQTGVGKFYQLNNQPSPEKEIVDDIADSAQAKLHLASMNESFAEFVQSRRNVGDDSVFTEASFIFSVGYDGGTLFKRGSKAIWPLVLTLLNCNPSVRFVAGIGMFLAAIHDLVPGCAAEQSLFLDLFVPELNLLSKGIYFSYQNKENVTVKVFLQARLVCHSYDTPAGQKVFKLQGL
jgi:hypothetical protein